MGFIIPWEDPPWWAEERGESVKIGYGPKEWAKSEVIAADAEEIGAPIYMSEVYRTGIQRIEIEKDDLDPLIDLLLALQARRDGKRPPVGLVRIGLSPEVVDAAREREEDNEWIAFQRISLADGWPDEVEHDGRVYALDPTEEGHPGTSLANHPVADYYLKPRVGLSDPRPRVQVGR